MIQFVGSLVLQLLLIVLQEGRPKGVFSIDLYVMDVAALGAVEKESETICYRMDDCVSPRLHWS